MPYKKQGLIHFTCLNFCDLPEAERQKIAGLCEQVGGREYAKALFDLMTKDIGVRAAAAKYYCDETTLYRMRNRFYEAWYKT